MTNTKKEYDPFANDPYKRFEKDVINGVAPFMKENPLAVNYDKLIAQRQMIINKALELSARAYMDELTQDATDEATQRLKDMAQKK